MNKQQDEESESRQQSNSLSQPGITARVSRCTPMPLDEAALAARLQQRASQQAPAPAPSWSSQPSHVHHPPAPRARPTAPQPPRAAWQPSHSAAAARHPVEDGGTGMLTPRAGHKGPAPPEPLPPAAAVTPAAQKPMPSPAAQSLVALGAAAADGLNDAQRRAATFDPRMALVIFAPVRRPLTLLLTPRPLSVACALLVCACRALGRRALARR